MRYLFDLDGVLMEPREDGNYRHVRPYRDRIRQVNELHMAGHEVWLWSARGAESGKDWEDVTRGQLERFGVRFDRLLMGVKPHADIYIDDRAEHPDGFFDADDYGEWEDVA